MRKSVPVTALLLIAALLVVSTSEVTTVSGFIESDSLQTGPYVDDVIFKIIYNRDLRFLALQSGETEMDSSFFYSGDYRTLDEDPNIDIYSAPRNGYGHLMINCAKYPLNISGLRRAFAFAYNKTAAVNSLHSGIPGFEHDSLVPLPNGFCIEDQFYWHYYAPQPDIGNQILDDLNFTIDAETGYRLAPDGSSFNITIEYTGCSCELSGIEARIGVDALLSLDINARVRGADFHEYISRLDRHGDYDILSSGRYFHSNDVDWLAYEYWSEYSDVEGENPTNFANAAYDSWREQLLHGTTYDAVYEAAMEMQKILHYNVPVLVTHVKKYYQAYRIDQYTGHVEDLCNYISGPWTMRKIHKIDGTSGGSVPVAQELEFMSFNFFWTQSSISESPYNTITESLHSSLYKKDSSDKPIPDLATEMTTETHSDDPAILDGNTRFTIDILQNATWSDGTPLTAEDVASTFVYAKESALFGNPVGRSLINLVAAYAPTPSRVVLEFNTESYWHFNSFAFDYIIPLHIFNNSGGIGYEEWESWNPVFNQTHPFVTCGPFIVADYVRGNYFRIKQNPLFHYASDFENTVTSTNPPSTTPETNQTTIQEIDIPLTVASVVGGFSSVVILYCGVRILQKRRGLTST